MKQSIKQKLDDVLKIARREIATVLNDRRLAMTVLVAPLAYALLMSFVYIEHQVDDLPIAVIQNDDSAFARSLVRMFEASPKLHVSYRVNSEDDLKHLMLQNKIDAAVIIPKDFSLRIKRGEDAFVGGFINASTLIPANTTASAINTVVQTFSVGVATQKLQKSGMPRGAALRAAMPVKVSIRPMFNPGYNYSNFIVPGLFITIIQQIILMGVALSMSGERERKTLGSLFRLSDKPVLLMAGKILPYFLLNVLIAEFYLRVLFPLNNIPIAGSWYLTLFFTTLFIATITSWGFWVSCLCSTQLFATQILMFIALPSFLLSGFTWPLSAMPTVIRGVAHLLPMTHFVTSFRNIYLGGATMMDVLPSIAALLAFLILNLILAYWAIGKVKEIHETTAS